MNTANEYSNKTGLIDKCIEDAKSSQRYSNATDVDIRQICEDALPTYLNTRTFAMVVAGALITYFNMVLISFCVELVANPTKYSLVAHWFALTTSGISESSGDGNQYSLDDLSDPSPEYMPPLPPYREKVINQTREVQDDSPSHSQNLDGTNQTDQRNIIRIE